ncbi:MAG: hypothetical protein PHC69_05515, partial [Ruminiclostridium sp.]|nr:hypothetical protein [Ruminiclostridium sp.]
MLCNENLSQSISYIEKQLNKNKVKRFEKHLKKCEKCKEQFNIIALNYDSTLNSDTVPSIKADIINGIDHTKYLRSNSRRLVRKWAVVAAGFILVIGVGANAQSIYKSLEEMIKSIRPTEEYLKHINRAAGIIDSNPSMQEQKSNKLYEECNDMFNKVRDKVYERGNEMSPNEYDEKLYPDLHEDFYVKIYKLSTGELVISYGIKNEVQLRFDVNCEASTDENMIQQTIDKANFIAMPDYLPQDYSFKSITTSDGRVQRISFFDKHGNSILMSYDSYIDSNLGNLETSLVTANEMQAIYHETEVERYLYIYLGDNMDKKIISLIANDISKEELLNVANSLIFYNSESNLLTKENYFKEVRDERLVSIFDELITREMSGDKMFDIYISREKGNTEIVKFSKNDAGQGGWCTVNYLGMSYEAVKQNLNYPLMFDRECLGKYEVSNMTVSFRPFTEVKTVRYILKLDFDNTSHRVHVEARGLPMEYKRFTKLDYLMTQYFSNDDTVIIRD